MALAPQTADAVAGILKNYRANVAKVRDNPRLSDEGRHAAAFELYEDVRSRVEKLRAEDTATQQARQRELRRTLFGPGAYAGDAAVVSYRDAQDRVAAVHTAEDLGELMERAHVSDDQLLLKAGFAHAWQQSTQKAGGEKWRALVDAYCNEYPAVKDRVGELYSLTHGNADQAVRENIATSVPRPDVLLRAPENLRLTVID